MNNKLRTAFYFLSKSKIISRLATRIAFDSRGENNCEIETNGEMLVLKNFLRSNDVVFDVGANVGDWTKTVLGINKNLSIYSFEPCKETFESLKKNSFPDNITLNNIGLGSKEEKKEFFVAGNDSTVNSVFEGNICGDNAHKEIVDIDTVDGYCLKKGLKEIDFLKIDVEGFDYEVLLGAKTMFSNKKIGICQIEYGGTYINAGVLLKDVFSFFQNNTSGYKFYKIKNNGIQDVIYKKDLENFQYCNYLIIRDDRLKEIPNKLLC